MPLIKYSIESAPSPRDQDRYKLNLDCTEEEVKSIVKQLSSISSRHFPSSNKDYKWSVFLYNLNPALKQKLESELNKALAPNAPERSQPAVEEQKAPSPPKPEEDKKEQPKATVHVKLIPEYTFDSFVVGASTRFTYAACKSVAENPGKNYNPLFIYGGVGLGKTHLMHAIGNHVIKKFPDFTIAYVTTDEFEREVVQSIEKGNLSYMRDKYKSIDLLLIDDIQFLERSESTQEEFFHIFNDMYDMGKQIIITSDKPPKKLVTLEDRLKSRFEWGLTTDIKIPNYETRVAILKKKSDKLGLNISEDINNYIAENLKSNIRELEGITNRLYAYQQLSGENITFDFIQDIIVNLMPSENPEKTEEKPAPQHKPKEDPAVVKPAIPVNNSGTSQYSAAPASNTGYSPSPYPPPPQSPVQSGTVCNRCRSAAIYVPQYQKWYCPQCRMYVEDNPMYPPPPDIPPPPPPQSQAQTKICSRCGMNMRFINEYNKFYCDNCREYESQYQQPQGNLSNNNPAPSPSPAVKSPDSFEIPSAVKKSDSVTEKKEDSSEKHDDKNFESKVIGSRKDNIREIKAAYFLPEGQSSIFSRSLDKLAKLATQKKFNFFISPQFTHYYSTEQKINYEKIAHMAKSNDVDIALCLEPADKSGPPLENFRKNLADAMDAESMPFEILRHSDMRESDALNFMLDIAICARKK